METKAARARILVAADEPANLAVMRRMDGYEVLKALRAIPRTRTAEVGFVTGRNAVEDETQAFVDYWPRGADAEPQKAR